MYKFLSVAALSMCALAPAAAQTVGNMGSAQVSQTSVMSGRWQGQSFVAAGPTLGSFSFRISDVYNPGGTLTFQIDRFTSPNQVGNTLFSTTITPTGAGVYTVSGINLATTVGGNYVAVLTPFNAAPGSTQMAVALADGASYGNGTAIAGFVGTNPANTTGDTSLPIDLIFAADFTPEPASWAMMIAGFGVIGGALRIRRRRGLALA